MKKFLLIGSGILVTGLAITGVMAYALVHVIARVLIQLLDAVHLVHY